jgi:hypothetical protein
VLGRSAESRDSNPLYAEFAAALDKYDFRFRLGEKVTGTVLLVLNKGIYVDIGAKSAAFCPIAECGMGKVARVRSARPARGNPKPVARRPPSCAPWATAWSLSSSRRRARRRTRSCSSRCGG